MIRRLLLTIVFAGAAHAASEFPPHLRWQTLTTDHFLVHFHDGLEPVARRAAALAEDAHARLSPAMHWTPSGRTHLIVTDHVDVSNGSVTPFPRNRIVVYVSAPGGDPSSPIAYYDDWLELVIVHEYAHILHLDQARGLSRPLRAILGRNPIGFPNEWAPYWMIEGLATFYESELTEAGRVKGTFAEMVLRTAAIEDRWPSEAQASGLTARWPGGAARYLFGSKFLAWLAERYGSDAVARYFNEYSSRIIYQVNDSARKVFGKSIRRLWQEWSEEWSAAALPPLSNRAERVTHLGYETKHPTLSPDGTRIAFTHRGPHERPTIRVIDTAGKLERSLEVNTLSPLSWSPDGAAIAFSQLEYAGSFSLLSDLYLWHDGAVQRITRAARLKDPAFADERTLIAVENRGGRNRLVEVEIASGAVRPLVTPDGETQFSEPHVRGDRIAVAEWHDGRIDVVLYARDGTRVANLTESLPRSVNASPRFTDDGASVVFMSDVTGIPNAFAVSVNGGVPRRLTDVYGGAFFPSSRDGRTIYFADYHSEGFDVAVVEGGAFSTVPLVRAERERRGTPPDQPAGTPAFRYRADVRPTWWSPVWSEDGFGATTSGGDVLGFHRYAATVTTESDSLVYSYDRWYPTFTLATAGYTDEPVAFRTDEGVVAYEEKNRRILAQVSAPLRRYRWQTTGWIGAVRDRIDGEPPAGVPDAALERAGVFRGTLQGVRIGALFNSAQTYGFSISPENGITARVDYENLSRALGSDRAMQQYRADLRGYLGLPRDHVLAARVAGGKTTGHFVLQRELRVGGVGEGLFAGLDTRSFPVRGYEGSTLRGNRAAIGSVEYRLPLWNIDRGPTTWPIYFHRILGDVFADYGTAWQRDGTRRAIASVGAEAAADIFLHYFLPLRYRVGVAYRLNDPDRGKVVPFVALESSF
ncbi:MAG TPA: BamA/TamA family outer membrane protein [Thermoanaerobaculia bacterium]|nr:BamA/TamA family outer membrane protein [Thermoanaerobaculia bacterium]